MNGTQVPVPDGSSLRLAPTTDWASKIHENSKYEDENVLCDSLENYRNACHPKFVVRNWLTTLENLGGAPDRSHEWRQRRADLLLKYLEDRHRLELLHGAIDQIKAIDEKPFLLPEEDEKMYFVVRQLIEGNPGLAFQTLSKKQPVFMIAASQGAIDIVSFALKTLKSSLGSKFSTSKEEFKEELFRLLKVSDRAANTALGLAVGEGHTDIVKLLLDTERRLAGGLLDDHVKQAVGKCEIGIMDMVLDAQPQITNKLPETIVQYGGRRYKEMWTAMAPRFEKFLPEMNILHLAVRKGKLDIVDWLVLNFPQMVIKEDEWGRIALSYNTDPAIKESVRRLIVPEIVRLCNPVEMKRYLQIAKDTPRQASLDLRVFNQPTHDFAHFVELVKANIRTPSTLHIKPDLAPNINFESVLRYVHFPDLSQGASDEDQSRERQEVPLILQWLRQKRVRTILKLVVPDCRVNPLDEDSICRCLEDYGIEELNWRRLDLGIEPILSLAPTLAVLYLYSSGNWAVLSHWVSEGGLGKLEKLKKLHIIIVEDSLTFHQAERFKQRANDQICELKSRRGWKWDPQITIEKWSSGMKLMQRFKGVTDATDLEEKTASSCIKLDAFVREYTNTQQARLERSANSKQKPLRKIKIALIDTGISAMGDKSHLQIKPGMSFGHGADGESESPWWIPSNEHGPQMADIIYSIDPYCEIYPVKITDDTDGGAVKAPPIIDAIKWAVDQDVDIISLSLVLFNSHEDLYKAVSAARQKDIVIICSTADRGNNQQKVYPAQYWKPMKEDCLFPIACCDQHGKLTDYSTETEAKYYFLGKDVTARATGVMRHSTKEISGSSVATAIAAGTASLVLACSRLALDEMQFSRKQRIEIFFEKMQTEENIRHSLKYVEPAIIFGENCIQGTNLETYIKRVFGNIRLPK